MNSKEFYRVVSRLMSPWCKASEFSRLKGTSLGWSKRNEDNHSIFYFQANRWGFDLYAGSTFGVEVQLSKSQLLWPREKNCREGNLAYFLPDADVEEIRQLTNVVIARLPRPPEDYVQRFGKIAGWYRQKFEPVTEPWAVPFGPDHNIRFRFRTEEDLQMWAEFLQREIPKALHYMVDWPYH